MQIIKFFWAQTKEELEKEINCFVAKEDMSIKSFQVIEHINIVTMWIVFESNWTPGTNSV